MSDLFGQSFERSARFIDSARIELRRRWATDGQTAFVLGHNPSDAGEDRDDPTSKWWNRWFEHYGFAGYSAGNIYPFVSSDPKECLTRVRAAIAGDCPADLALLERNIEEVAAMAGRADQVFVCFGNLGLNAPWSLKVINRLRDESATPGRRLWCWGLTKHGGPTHPMARGKHRIDPLAPAQLWL